MALPSTLFKFQIDLSDVDRNVYEVLQFRVAMHPSETPPYLLTRVIAYALNFTTDLQFTPGGLSDPDAPALLATTANGTVETWIEVGNASARKLNKATKAAKQVLVYTYKDAKVLLSQLEHESIHKKHSIEIYAIPTNFLSDLETHLGRDNKWTMISHDGHITVNVAEISFQCALPKIQIAESVVK